MNKIANVKKKTTRKYLAINQALIFLKAQLLGETTKRQKSLQLDHNQFKQDCSTTENYFLGQTD